MKHFAILLCAGALAGCAVASGVQDAGNGNYLISARAAPIRGGTVGAQNVAYDDANKFCAQRQPGTHAVIADSMERDVYQGGFGASGGNASGGVFAAGNATLRFRCGQ